MERLFIPPTPLFRRFHRALIAEFMGTCMLVLAIAMSSMCAPNPPIAIGFTLLTQVFAYGYISGGMFNPAVTTGVQLVRLKRGEDGRHIFNGWISLLAVQVMGGFCGAFLGWFLGPTAKTRGNFPAPLPDEDDSMGLARTFVAELVYTFTLVSVVLNCAVSKKYGHSGNHFYGLAIGMSVMTGAMCVGMVSGASFNPAVTVALQVVQCLATSEPQAHVSRCGPARYMYLYLIAQFLAGYFAAFVFCTVSCEDHNDDGSPKEQPDEPNTSTTLIVQRRS